jgi:hypothetical protein
VTHRDGVIVDRSTVYDPDYRRQEERRFHGKRFRRRADSVLRHVLARRSSTCSRTRAKLRTWHRNSCTQKGARGSWRPPRSNRARIGDPRLAATLATARGLSLLMRRQPLGRFGAIPARPILEAIAAPAFLAKAVRG